MEALNEPIPPGRLFRLRPNWDFENPSPGAIFKTKEIGAPAANNAEEAADIQNSAP